MRGTSPQKQHAVKRFYRNLKGTLEDLLPRYCYAIKTNTRKNPFPSLATQRSEHE